MPPLLMFILLLTVSFAVIFYLVRPTKAEVAVQRHLETIKVAQSDRGEEGITILKEEGYSPNPAISGIVRQIPGAKETLDLIGQAGRAWPVSAVLGIVGISMLLTAAITSFFLPDVLPLLAALVAGAVPYSYLLILRERRLRLCDKLLPEAIDLMARGLRAGHALPAVLEMVGEEISEPLGAEFRTLHEEQTFGLPLRDAVMNMVGRVPRDDMRFLATAILLQKETGGNLAVILDKTAVVARERERLRGQLRIYTAQGRITGWILCIMPFLMFGLLSMLNWNTEKVLFTDHLGKIAVYTGLGFMACGILVIRHIVNVKV
ncbi:MAG TPA: type II secretion system F family protein [Terriglobales bacterium]|nr:type II secretion system F family protein [Terriglobales bacterium]